MFFTALNMTQCLLFTATAQLFCRTVAVLNKSLEKTKISIYILLWIVYIQSILWIYILLPQLPM